MSWSVEKIDIADRGLNEFDLNVYEAICEQQKERGNIFTLDELTTRLFLADQEDVRHSIRKMRVTLIKDERGLENPLLLIDTYVAIWEDGQEETTYILSRKLDRGMAWKFIDPV